MINTKSAKSISAKDWIKKVFYNDTVTKSLLKGLPKEEKTLSHMLIFIKWQIILKENG